MTPRRTARPGRRARSHPALAIACAAALAAAWSPVARPAAAAAVGGSFAEFDRSMLAGHDSTNVDLARFEHGNPILPGLYNLDVYVNHNWVGRMNIRFQAPAPDASAAPCVDAALLARMGLHAVAHPPAAASPHAACATLGEFIPGATLVPDLGDLRLDASVPQAYLGEVARGYVNPAALDAGVTAFVLDYSLNSYHSTSAGQGLTSTYLGLRSGLNVAGWQLRQDSTVTWLSGEDGMPGRRRWQSIDAYAQRPFARLRAKLTLGDSYTDGAVFDSFGLRGVQFATDDQMLPPSLRGYAPTVRGIAQTNAKVTVSQNGVQLYQTTVAPGPFVIRDLYPTGYGGDLEVTVTEADGRQTSFRVPYAAVAQSLRPGVTRFDLAAGQLRNTSLLHRPGVFQAAIQRGFTNLVTLYGGAQASAGYGAMLGGGALNTRLGAFALDLTAAHAEIPHLGTRNGQSLRLTYTRIIPETDTSLSVAAYRYSTSGFLSLTDAETARDFARRGLDALQWLPTGLPQIDGVALNGPLTPAQRAALAGSFFNPNAEASPAGLLQQRNRFTLSLGQRLGAGGSLYANASINDYWNQRGRDTQFQLGYNNHLGRLAWGLSLMRGRTLLGGYDNQVFFNASLALGHGPHAPSLTANLTHSDAFGSQQQVTLGGAAGRWSQFGYGATLSNGGAGAAASVSGSYASPYATLGASVGQGNHFAQQSLSASGTIVAHPGGVTFGQPAGDTLAIVHVPGAVGAHVASAPGLRVGRSGYVLVPYLMPYQLDTIDINPEGMPLGVQLDATSAAVAPYAGAVIMVNFKTDRGRPLIARIRLPDGHPAPFGAEVFDAEGQALGVVGQAGVALVRGVTARGRLEVRWQDQAGTARRCGFAYTAPQKATSLAADAVTVTCRAIGTGAGQPAEPST